MTILFGSSHPICFNNVQRVTTDTNYYDSNYTRNGILLYNNETIGVTLSPDNTLADESDYWLHFRMHTYAGNTAYVENSKLWGIFDENGDDVVYFYLNLNNSGYIRFTTDSGYTDVTSLNGGFSIGSPTGHTYDVHVYQDGTDAKCDVYRDGSSFATFTRASQSARGIKSFLFGCPSSGNTMRNGVSEVILSENVSTLYMRLAQGYSSSQGYHTDFVGDYSNIDELIPDTNAIQGVSSGDKESWEISYPGAGGQVYAVVQNMLGAAEGSLKVLTRIDSTDYSQTINTQDDEAYPLIHVWSQDPSTSDAWGASGDLPEFGVEVV